VVVDNWGPLVLHGHSFSALATVHLEESNGPVEPLAHHYDISRWHDITDAIDLVERSLDIDGTEVVILCLRESLATNKYRYLRLSLQETE